MTKLKGYFNDWSMFEKLWLVISTLMILGTSLYWGDGLIGITAAITGIWCVLLVAKGKIGNYYVGIINVIAYAYVAYTWQYYGEVMLNLIYFLPMQFVGLYLWKGNMKGNNKAVKVKFMTWKQRIFWAIGSAAVIIIYGIFLRSINGNLPFLDSTSTVLSVIAMVLMAIRYMEQWILWIIVNIVSIGLWAWAFSQGGTDVAVLVMWTAYLVNSVYGLVNWTRMFNNQTRMTIVGNPKIILKHEDGAETILKR